MRSVLLSHRQVGRILDRLAYEILERNRGADNVELIGVRERGAALAAALADRLEDVAGRTFTRNRIDVGPYRDDRDFDAAVEDTSQIQVDVSDRDVILVDDVLFTGRTARAALDALVRHGRPRSVQLVVLVDRGHREYPIQPDYSGRVLPTKHTERVVVEVDDAVVVYLEEE